MQIVINIDDNLYTRLFDNGDEYVADMRRACVAIRKGTPFDKIRAEIEERKLNSGGEPNRDLAFNVCLQIIDKYRAESEG